MNYSYLVNTLFSMVMYLFSDITCMYTNKIDCNSMDVALLFKIDLGITNWGMGSRMYQV